MSPSIWTRCGGRRSCGPYEGAPWRVVEAQHVVSTRRLVDDAREQELLESLIDRAKAPVPEGAERLHYLLFTPFRHPPLLHGSRFGARHEPSLWYGSEELETAFAELAYYRLVFLEGTEAALGPITVELSAFQAKVKAAVCADLTAPPFSEYALALRSPSRYDATQALGAEMRADGVEAIRYASARDPGGGVNVALFTARVFARNRPTVPQSWLCVATRAGVEIRRKDYFVRKVHAFPRAVFEVRGELPVPAA